MAKLNVRNRNKDKFDKDGKPKAANWEYRFEAAKIDGKRKHISKAGFRTKKEAEIAGNAALAQYNSAGKHFTPAEISVADFFDYWLENYSKVNSSDNTTLGYKSIVENHIKPRLGLYRLRAIDTVAIQTFINAMHTENEFSQSYIKNILKVVKNGLKYAHKTAKFINENPAEDVTTPNIDPEEEEILVLTKEEVADILDRFKKSPFQYYPMLIAYYTGLRVSEVFGLTWNDIDFEKKTLTVNKIAKKFDYNAKNEKGYRGIKGKSKTIWYLGACKTKSSYRTISIGDTLINALLDYKELQEANKREYGDFYIRTYAKDELTNNKRKVKRIIQAENSSNIEEPFEEVNLICVRENGAFSGTDSMKYPSQVINSKLGINFKFHALRHTHATMLIEQGLPIKAVSERLGHSSSQITWDVYVKVTEKMETEVVETFEAGSGLKLRNEYLYGIWRQTVNQCSGNNFYKKKNIKVCEEWQNDFKAFEQWAEANGFEEGLRLLRIDKEGDYEPDNCQWGTESKTVKGQYVYADGENMKSYSVRKVGRGWQYRISDYNDQGKRIEHTRAGFPTEEEAAIAAEEVICELFKKKQSKPMLRLVQ